MSSTNDPKRFYRIESREILDGLSSELVALSRGDVHPEATVRLFRLAHTLKGAATVVGEDEVAELARIVEDVLGAHRESGEPLDAREINELLRMVENLGPMLEGEVQRDQSAESNQSGVGAALPELFDTIRVDLEDLDGVTTTLADAELQTSALLQTLRELESAARALGHFTEEVESPKRADVTLLSAVRATDRRLQEALRDTLDRIGRARRSALARAESVAHDIRQARENVGGLELIPAASAFPTLDRAVQLAASSVGKTAVVAFSGGDVRLDRRVLPSINEALLHIVRNAVDHGIEPVDARVARGKSREGHIALVVERRGSRVAFICQDDGYGIDPEEIRRKAVERRLLSVEEADAAEDAALLGFLFRAGFSTKSNVTDLSGRGVGLDVVGTIAAKLRGEVALTSQFGTGTRVELVVPVSLATAAAIMLRVDDTRVFLPLDSVRCVRKVSSSMVLPTSDGETMAVDGEIFPVLRLAAALDLGRRCSDASTELVALVVTVGKVRFVLLADAALGISEVVVRPLPWAAGSPCVVAGAALDVEGGSKLVIDPRGLLTVLNERRGGAESGRVSERSVLRYSPILVIDDSLTTRMLEQSILETAGFEVDVATSAEEGLGMARARNYGLFVVDVEMPGMNGFEFTATTRADAELREVAVILVTSLSSEEDQRRGREAGAAAYVVKGQFNQDQFLERIRSLCKVVT